MSNLPEHTPEPFDIRAFLKGLTTLPGVYRMFDADDQVIYVGKANNLKRRVSSYFQKGGASPKTRVMVRQVRRVEVTVTRTEGEALLLENNLIKALKPRYNVLLRDDKSYPYIRLSEGAFPRLSIYRGRRTTGRYFGPFPSASAVRESLNLLQKLFPVRQCEDSFFRNRTRPCLQYQIRRCSAPCVGLITPGQYAADLRHAVMFLEGKSSEVVDELVRRMEEASSLLEFEEAARFRDQIINLRRVQERQYVTAAGGDIDVVAAILEQDLACIQVFFIRGGRNLGNRTFFPGNSAASPPGELMGAFLAQFYLEGESDPMHTPPAEIIVNQPPEDAELLERVLTEQVGRRVVLSSRVRGDRARWVEMAEKNARLALGTRLASKANLSARFEALQEALGLDAVPQRLECIDVSHTMGEATVASCVVFDSQGAVKSDYRRYNIEGLAPGDDYGAMRQVLTRRFRRLKQEEGVLPDVLFIDGGKGQLAQAEAVLEELQVIGVTLVGVAKGRSRKPGLEQLVLPGSDPPIILPPDSIALHLIQQVRDEAHRFAITGHRQRRAKARKHSTLEAIPGLGPKRRQQLLRQFGGLQEVARAGVEELAGVHGISRALAQRIYDTLHQD